MNTIKKDELYDLFIVKNWSYKQLSKYFNLSLSQIYRYCVKYKLKKNPKAVAKNVAKTIYERYGVDNISKLESIKQLKKQISIDKYGKDSYFQTEAFKQKANSTKLKRYGRVNYNNRKKAEEYCLKKYNVANPSQIQCVQEKKIKTTLKRYGVKNPSQANIIKKKKRDTLIKHYGTYTPMLIPSFCKKVIDKGYETRKLHNTCNTSKAEEKIYKILQTKFNVIERQYKSEVYPFACDFYIPDLDLYIEYQGTWLHGRRVYLGTEDDLKQIEVWKAKSTKYYQHAIKVWTVRDVIKREIAKKNNLNWIEFFNIEQFENWFKNLSTDNSSSNKKA